MILALWMFYFWIGMMFERNVCFFLTSVVGWAGENLGVGHSSWNVWMKTHQTAYMVGTVEPF